MKKKTQKIIAIGLTATLIGSSVIAPCARAFSLKPPMYSVCLPSLVYVPQDL